MWLCRPSMDGRLTQRPAGRMLGFQGFICLARAGGQRSAVRASTPGSAGEAPGCPEAWMSKQWSGLLGA